MDKHQEGASKCNQSVTNLDVSGLLGDVVVIMASGHHLIRNGLHVIDGLHFGWIANAEGGNYSRRLSTG